MKNRPSTSAQADAADLAEAAAAADARVVEGAEVVERTRLIAPSNDRVASIGSSRSINLNDAAAATHSVHLNPSRDGVYSQIRSMLMQAGASGVVGAAVGYGVYELQNHTANQNTFIFNFDYYGNNLPKDDD